MAGAKKLYEAYAAAFEVAVSADKWSEVGSFFGVDAVYVDAMGASIRGRDEIVNHLRASVAELDNKFTSRTLEISGLVEVGDTLEHVWHIEYSRSDLPNMELCGKSVVKIVEGEIEALTDILSDESRVHITTWLAQHGHLLD